MKETSHILCSLCTIELLNDAHASQRMKRHTYFHKMAWIQNRNTACGTPKYFFKNLISSNIKKGLDST
jgi:hypothetical protein